MSRSGRSVRLIVAVVPASVRPPLRIPSSPKESDNPTREMKPIVEIMGTVDIANGSYDRYKLYMVKFCAMIWYTVAASFGWYGSLSSIALGSLLSTKTPWHQSSPPVRSHPEHQWQQRHRIARPQT